MIRHGEPPYLEVSSAGDRRFSALYARLVAYDFQTVEEVYQSSKHFTLTTVGVNHCGKMINWREAKGQRAENQSVVDALYIHLWRTYLEENPSYLHELVKASGLSDRFGQPGHNCQATVLWQLRNEYLAQ